MNAYTPRTDDPRLQPSPETTNSWLSFDEIEALGADPWDFARNEDREIAAGNLVEVDIDNAPHPEHLIADCAETSVPIYTNDILDWAQRPRVAQHLDRAVESREAFTFDRLLRIAACDYWYEVYSEALQALHTRADSVDD